MAIVSDFGVVDPLTVGLAAGGVYLLSKGIAGGGAGGGGGGGTPGLTPKELSEKWAGHYATEVPDADLMAIYRRSQQLVNAPPPPGGSEHMPYDFIVIPAYPPDRLTDSLFMRQSAAERDQDLVQMRADLARAVAGQVWFPRVGENRRLMRATLIAQKDWGVLGTGISPKQLFRTAAIVGGSIVGGPAGAAAGAGAGKAFSGYALRESAMEQMTVSLPKLALFAAAGGLLAYFVAPKRSRRRWAGYAALATGVGGYVVTSSAIKKAQELQKLMRTGT